MKTYRIVVQVKGASSRGRAETAVLTAFAMRKTDGLEFNVVNKKPVTISGGGAISPVKGIATPFRV